MRWEQDLVTDIRIGDPELDDQDRPFGFANVEWGDLSSTQGIKLAQEKFLSIRDNCRSILEIGVNQFGFTRTWLDNKHRGTVYIGIDIEDRSKVADQNKLIWTIHNSSSNVKENIAKIKEIGITEFDFIFIDGWHSINQVLLDWEYTELLSPIGTVGFHDTNYHPGPLLFTTALDRDKWEVESNSNNYDWGVVFARRK